MATTTTATETTTVKTTEAYVETMYTAAFATVNTDGAPVKRYNIGTNYTFGTHTYSIVGVRKYTGDAHSYWLVKFDSDPTTHELTADKIKDYIGDDRKQPRNGSANDTEHGTAQKSKRTAKETAAQIKTKYADTIKVVREKVSKLQADERITSALNLLCTMIEQTAAERIENITNAVRNAYLANVARRDEIKQTLETNKFRLARAVANDDDEQIMEIGKNNKELKAELLLIEQKIAEYESAQIEAASKATEETETTETETTAEETVSEQPAE